MTRYVGQNKRSVSRIIGNLTVSKPRDNAHRLVSPTDVFEQSEKELVMNEAQNTIHHPAVDNETHFDAVIVGAGFAGMGMLHKLRKLGFTAKVYEAGGNVGGTARQLDRRLLGVYAQAWSADHRSNC